MTHITRAVQQRVCAALLSFNKGLRCPGGPWDVQTAASDQLFQASTTSTHMVLLAKGIKQLPKEGGGEVLCLGVIVKRVVLMRQVELLSAHGNPSFIGLFVGMLSKKTAQQGLEQMTKG
ncbi:hypothetical protein Q8A67_022087 [Cirrhinus molitorella]|uniref:Uncharacterized protein n=1 Tax=Cirrhinus molitorella TaxID=172907 RepID=A0AA88P4L8_9TELE|nr:hypothetical protein Q8A67_022087 [Cirrhinus molitorella]